MNPRTKDWIYGAVPLPVLQHTLPRLRPGRNPFLPHHRETEVVFIHIPKTAGTSLVEELYGDVRGGHRSVAEYAAFDEERLRRYFTCAFVRNPWDRLLSAYSFLTQGVMTTDRDDAFGQKLLDEAPDFESFVLKLPDPRFRWKVAHFDHFRTQAFWICLPRQRTHVMDFLGRFENLATDFDRLREELRRTSPAARQALDRSAARTDTIVHNRTSTHAPYQDAYTPRMRQIVGEVYRRDVETFGYSF